MSTATTKADAPGKGDPKATQEKSLTGGPQRFFFIGLIDSAPMEFITVPTCVLEGGIRGTAPCVPKKSAKLTDDGKGGLIHIEGGRVGDHVKLYPVEYEAFVKYCETHVFRKTSTYSVKQPDGSEKEFWRADIEAIDAGPGNIRILGDDADIKKELLSKYVWIVPASLMQDGTPIDMGPQLTIAQVAEEKKEKEKASAGK